MHATVNLKYRAQRIVRRLFFRHKSVSSPLPILLVSTRRSGSTWLAELLARSGPHCLIDQPFSYYHLNNRRGRLGAYYVAGVPKFTDSAVRKIFVDELLRYCRLPHPPNANWLPFAGLAPRSSRVIVKELDAKFLIDERHITDRFRVVVLRRSADATVASIMRNGWGHYIEGYMAQDEFVHSLDSVQREVAGNVVRSGSEIDKHFLSYCFENHWFYRSQQCGAIKIVDYEELRRDRTSQLGAIAEFCDIPAEHLLAVPANRPSRTSRGHSDKATIAGLRRGELTPEPDIASPMKDEILKSFARRASS